jgi:hypothetical protein
LAKTVKKSPSLPVAFLVLLTLIAANVGNVIIRRVFYLLAGAVVLAAIYVGPWYYETGRTCSESIPGMPTLICPTYAGIPHLEPTCHSKQVDITWHVIASGNLRYDGSRRFSVIDQGISIAALETRPLSTVLSSIRNFENKQVDIILQLQGTAPMEQDDSRVQQEGELHIILDGDEFNIGQIRVRPTNSCELLDVRPFHYQQSRLIIRVRQSKLGHAVQNSLKRQSPTG